MATSSPNYVMRATAHILGRVRDGREIGQEDDIWASRVSMFYGYGLDPLGLALRPELSLKTKMTQLLV